MRRLTFAENMAYGRIILGVGALSFLGFAWNYWLAGAVLGGILILGGISALVGLSGCCRVDTDKIKAEQLKYKTKQDQQTLPA